MRSVKKARREKRWENARSLSSSQLTQTKCQHKSSSNPFNPHGLRSSTITATVYFACARMHVVSCEMVKWL